MAWSPPECPSSCYFAPILKSGGHCKDKTCPPGGSSTQQACCGQTWQECESIRKFSTEAEGGGGERGLPGGLGICLDDVPGQWRTWIQRAAEVRVAEAFYRLVLPMVYLTDGRCSFQALNG